MSSMHSLVRQGKPIVVMARVEAKGQVKIGDMVWYHNGIARPASLFPPGLLEEHSLAGFADLFLGVAFAGELVVPDHRGGGVEVAIDLGIQSVYNREVGPGEYDIGDPLTVAHGENGLANQLLVRATDPKHVIAVAMERRTRFDDGRLLSVQFCSRFSWAAALRRAA